MRVIQSQNEKSLEKSSYISGNEMGEPNTIDISYFFFPFFFVGLQQNKTIVIRMLDNEHAKKRTCQEENMASAKINVISNSA